MKKFLIKGIVIIIMTVPFLFPAYLNSQTNPLKLKETFSSAFDLSKKVIIADSLNSDSTQIKKTIKNSGIKKFRMKKSPTTAVLLSAVLPGAGQFYNESYWKIPIIAGLVGYFGYEYFRQNNYYKDYRDQYSASQTPQNPEGNLSLKELREFYRDQRDDFIWYFTIVYVINLVDAYIDAHLFDFDVKDENTGTNSKMYRLNFKIKF
jgi:hypothetical protein